MRFLQRKNIAIVNLTFNYSSNFVFVPSEINGYTIKELGYPGGLGYVGSYYYLFCVSPFFNSCKKSSKI